MYSVVGMTPSLREDAVGIALAGAEITEFQSFRVSGLRKCLELGVFEECLELGVLKVPRVDKVCFVFKVS